MFRRVTAGVLGAVAVAASMVMIRSSKETVDPTQSMIPAGESVPAVIHPDRLRELGY